MINTNLEEHLKNHIELFESLTSILPSVEKIANIIIDTLENGNKILIAGNGGSAADSQHFAAELTGRFKVERKSLAAIALTTDTSAITAIGNDYSFDNIFDRQIEGIGNKRDLFFGISTSGNSKNILNALIKSKEIGCNTVSLLGKDGGKAKEIGNHNVIVPHSSTDRIQEAHIFIIHLICELVDNHFQNI